MAGPSGSPSPSGAITDPAAAWPAYASCLRAHGLDVPDPEIDPNGDPTWADGVDIKAGMNDQIRTDCGPIIATITSSGDRRPRRTYSFDSLVAHAACLRTHGLVDYPDPDPNDLAAGMPPGFDKSDQAVYDALVACESLLVETTASPSPAS